MAVAATGVRLRWDEVPTAVRSAVEQIVGGGPVVRATSQPGGFSPGTADRLLTATGRRAFVKAASPAQNADVCGIHRAEARVVAQFPRSVHLPELLGLYDDGEWVAAVYGDIEGRAPREPWRPAEIDAAASALIAVAALCTPNPVAGLRPLTDTFAEDYGGWSRVRADPPADLDPWARGRLDQLCELAAAGLAALAGDTLCHCDTRADNLIIRPDGAVAVIDWPWASLGAGWFDLLCLAVNVDYVGGADPENVLRRLPDDMEPLAVTGALAGLCGYFVDVARRPPPPGLPTVRAFQRAQGASTLRWLRRRLAS